MTSMTPGRVATVPPVAEDALARWIAEGRLKIREDVLDGLDQAPRALVGLLGGDNLGKRLVRVAPEPA